VLLPSVTRKKLITSITSVLFPFVTYLLTLPRMYYINLNNSKIRYVLYNVRILDYF
jgi:hypothetical protein